MKPIVYSTPDCHYCHALKDWLEDIGVPYEEIDASDLGNIPVVPETHIGDDTFIGFERRKILKSLKSHGLLSK